MNGGMEGWREGWRDGGRDGGRDGEREGLRREEGGGRGKGGIEGGTSRGETDRAVIYLPLMILAFGSSLILATLMMVLACCAYLEEGKRKY